MAWRGKAARTRTRALFPMVAVIWFRIAASISYLVGDAGKGRVGDWRWEERAVRWKRERGQ